MASNSPARARQPDRQRHCSCMMASTGTVRSSSEPRPSRPGLRRGGEGRADLRSRSSRVAFRVRENGLRLAIAKGFARANGVVSRRSPIARVVPALSSRYRRGRASSFVTDTSPDARSTRRRLTGRSKKPLSVEDVLRPGGPPPNWEAKLSSTSCCRARGSPSVSSDAVILVLWLLVQEAGTRSSAPTAGADDDATKPFGAWRELLAEPSAVAPRCAA